MKFFKPNEKSDKIKRYCSEKGISSQHIYVFPEELPWASNRYMATFELEEHTWSSSEQYMQYKKCERILNSSLDEKILEEILRIQDDIKNCSDADTAILLTANKLITGNLSINELLPEEWHKITKFTVLLNANEEKFKQNDVLKKNLIDTKQATLLGIGGNDLRWPAINRAGNFGENWAGQILMEVRENLDCKKIPHDSPLEACTQ